MSVERKPEARTRRTTAALVAGLALAAGGGCGDSGSADTDVVKFGAIFDLTGPTADVGTDYADGIRGFVEWRNARGGIEGLPIELSYQDYGYQVDRAEQ
ncbi:MAG: ABC transporter substrate-binding protein, partial [Gemmatimonadota bacterium]|nr:ABC transporter substrate-binding protein [Gemmatimonadota bacterium]